MHRFYALLIIVLSCYSVNGNINRTFYPLYHLAAIFGWINDPNGFCIYNGEYHLFYQYNPYSSLGPGTVHWGHAKSKDLYHWVNLPIALYPNATYDKDGAYSGSAIVENNTMYLFYTGNVFHNNDTTNYTQVQALASSTDGVNFDKYAQNPIIRGEDHQPNIRDPKVWKHDDYYYMVLGNSFNDGTLGRVLLYRSTDKINWTEVSVLAESDGSLGYMWECPDFFELDDRYVLLFSPQGIAPQGDRFKNRYQTGYITGFFNYSNFSFTNKTEFQELDFGHDFYASQTILDDLGRRLVVAWMDSWGEVYPERADGWSCHMTMIRELRLTADYKLIQKPIKEVENVRGKTLFAGCSAGGTKISLENNTGEVIITAPSTSDFTLYIESNNASATVTIKYNYETKRISIDRGGDDGLRRTEYAPEEKLEIRVFIDRSSIEIFFDGGRAVISSRYFPSGQATFHVSNTSTAEKLIVYEMKQTLYVTS